MDPSPTAAAAVPVSALALSIAPALAQAPLVLPGLFNPSPLPFPGQEVGRSESLMGKQLAREYFWTLSPAQEDGRTLTSASWSKRGACLWRPWLCFTSDSPRQATSGATSVKVTKADSKFHHPVRLFWSKSCSFDYLYSYGEILLQSFPVQATINLYEDSDSEEEEEDDEEDKEDEEEEK
ncbi:protein ripply1 isoform 1-T1 [Molossus nigricans]